MTGAVRSVSPVCGDEPRDGRERIIAHNKAVHRAGACPRCGSTELVQTGQEVGGG